MKGAPWGLARGCQSLAPPPAPPPRRSADLLLGLSSRDLSSSSLQSQEPLRGPRPLLLLSGARPDAPWGLWAELQEVKEGLWGLSERLMGLRERVRSGT